MLLGSGLLGAGEKKLTIWSHWADEDNKKEFVIKAVELFKKDNPDFQVEIVWYQKTQLITSLAAALEAGAGPDIFYLEPKIAGYFPYVDNGVMYDISEYVDDMVQDWAMPFVKEGDMTYLLPLETYGPLLYYNTEIMEKAGVTIPPENAFTTEGLLDAVRKIKAAGFNAFAAGTMDRDWCAAIVVDIILLRYAGLDAWQGVPTGKTVWTNPDLVAGLKYIEQLVKEGAYPPGVSSIRLGESHGQFFGGRYAMFPMKTFFGGRAFVPEDKGGMRADFPLGIMELPLVPDGKGGRYNYIQIGGSYGVNAASQYPEKAAQLLAKMASPEMVDDWMANTKCPAGLKFDPVALEDPYFAAIENAYKGTTLVPGPMFLGMDPTYRDVYLQTSTALVAGQISVDDMVSRLETARQRALR
ncbi:MAG: ABC transporter substrate-binding protein [Planctomycetes bacterium]|nr:ABC transporter substrate-binding protein [Planctomycetota bacterium]